MKPFALVLFICALGGLSSAFFLYYKGYAWPKAARYGLATLRFLVIAGLFYLLLAPSFRQKQWTEARPLFVVAVDNSRSVGRVADSVNTLGLWKRLQDKVQTWAQKKNAQVRWHVLEQKTGANTNTGTNTATDTLRFSASESNLSALLERIHQSYEGKNLIAAALLSDGIYRPGRAPEHLALPFPVFTLGIGDTRPRKDIRIAATQYNSIAYLNTRIPLTLTLTQTGYTQARSEVRLRKGNTVLSKAALRFDNTSTEKISLRLDANQAGLQRYTVEVLPLEGEFNTQNNRTDLYIDVIEGRVEVLLLAPVAHPDLKALRAALEKKALYRTELLLAHKATKGPALDSKDYDVLILHQAFGQDSRLEALYRPFLRANTPTWFVLSPRAELARFHAHFADLQMQRESPHFVEVFPQVNPAFAAFSLEKKLLPQRRTYPPLQVPDMRIQLRTPMQVLLYQRVGTALTKKPLWLMGKTAKTRMALLLGEGIWTWPLLEYAQHENQEAFEEMVVKTVQYLATQDDKRRFKVRPVKNVYAPTEAIAFRIELYNKTQTPVAGHPVTLRIKNAQGYFQRYGTATTTQGALFQTPALQAGAYTYAGRTIHAQDTLRATGSFFVDDQGEELRYLSPDFGALQRLSQKTKGAFFPLAAYDSLIGAWDQLDIATTRYAHTRDVSLIDVRMLFFLLFFLLAAEWGLRKYLGST